MGLCEIALAYNPEHVKAMRRMAHAFCALQRFEEAEATLTSAARLRPKDSALRQDLARVRRQVEGVRRKAKEWEREAYRDMFERLPGFATPEETAKQAEIGWPELHFPTPQTQLGDDEVNDYVAHLAESLEQEGEAAYMMELLYCIRHAVETQFGEGAGKQLARIVPLVQALTRSPGLVKTHEPGKGQRTLASRLSGLEEQPFHDASPDGPFARLVKELPQVPLLQELQGHEGCQEVMWEAPWQFLERGGSTASRWCGKACGQQAERAGAFAPLVGTWEAEWAQDPRSGIRGAHCGGLGTLGRPLQHKERGMRLMGPSEDRWFDLAQLAWTEHTWMVQLNESHGSISHRPCPWGGHLLKFSFDHVHVSNCAQAAGVMIRPELRPLAREGVNVHQHVAPGDVVLTGPSVAIKVGDECEGEAVRRFAALFGNLGAPFFISFDTQSPTDNVTPERMAIRQQRRTNFPERGDVTTLSRVKRPQKEALMVARSDGESTFRVCFIFNEPVVVSAHWVPECLRLMLKLLRQELIRTINRPHLADLRKADQDFYVILSMQHFKRGPPMLPHAGPSEPDVCISTERGPSAWSRFPQQKGFQAARYMQLFLERLGYDVHVFDCLDGRRLVPYQCAIRRDVWQKLRDNLAEAFGLQRSAYRRANGGPQAPELREDLQANLRLPRRSWDLVLQVPRPLRWPRVVVRRTFLEVEDEHEEGPHMARANTIK
ncbi:unnamed protein product [Effrenium voratum]|nr:unnamed protein product [Effrenium voratum]